MIATAPDAPTGLTSTAATADSITLSWGHSGSPEPDSYILTYNKKDDSTEIEIQAGIITSPFTVTELEAATSYVFSLVAVKENDNSAPSVLDTATGELNYIDDVINQMLYER